MTRWRGPPTGRHALIAGVAIIAVLLAAYATAPAVIGLLGLVGGSALAVVLTVVSNLDSIEKWTGRLLGSVRYLGGTVERTALAANIQGTINTTRNELASELPDVMPHPARVKFVRTADDIARLQEGQVVIALQNPSRHAENTARAVMAYVSSETIRVARPYVGRAVMEGIDFSLTKRFLRRADAKAFDYFISEMWQEALQASPDLRDICDDVERIQRKNLLTRILLAEFLELGRRLYGEFPPPGVHEETREFVTYLAQVAGRAPDQHIEGEFKRAHIRAGVALVGARGVAEAEGARPYVQYCLRGMSRGWEAVYILARGARRALVREIADELEKDGRVRAVDVTEYLEPTTEGSIAAVCARVSVEQASRRSQQARRGEPIAVPIASEPPTP